MLLVEGALARDGESSWVVGVLQNAPQSVGFATGNFQLRDKLGSYVDYRIA